MQTTIFILSEISFISSGFKPRIAQTFTPVTSVAPKKEAWIKHKTFNSVIFNSFNKESNVTFLVLEPQRDNIKGRGFFRNYPET
jgi:hypothetical protein